MPRWKCCRSHRTRNVLIFPTTVCVYVSNIIATAHRYYALAICRTFISHRNSACPWKMPEIVLRCPLHQLLQVHASFDSRWSVSGCRTGLERSTATRSERAFSFDLPPRTKDRSVPVVVPWCDLTMYCALSARPSLSADLSPCTGCYKLILLTLYGGPAAAVR